MRQIEVNSKLEYQTNPDKLRCTGDHKRCCVVNRWNGSCVCNKCKRCVYCGDPILTDDIEEWSKNGYGHVALTNHHYSCAKKSILDPIVYQILGNMNNERGGYRN